jgi:LmbE family N-acetylglucosaminyl deacetylase
MRKDHPMRFRIASLLLLLMAVGMMPGAAAGQADARTLMAVFAHPDDERIVGPLLARYAREGHRVHLVIATDGSKGVTDHAGIPAGAGLAQVRAEEARCATERLGIEPPILLGLEDGGLASFGSLGRLREELTRLIRTLRPDALLTIGPEGGTGHPDHRLVGNVVTEVVQGVAEAEPPALYYASLPAERMRSAPPARPTVTAIPARYLRVQVPFAPEDFEAARLAFHCHASQYTEEQREAINRMLAHGFDGRVHLRPWHGSGERTGEILP